MTLLKRDHNAPASWRGDMPVTSRYTFGLAGERFFRTIQKEGRFLGTRCQRCDRVYVPAALFCERCMGELSDWVDVGTIGTVHTFTVLFEGLDDEPLNPPEIIAFVRLGDGGLIHRLGDVDPENVYVGMPVQAVFKAKSKREGSITDIVCFKPVE